VRCVGDKEASQQCPVCCSSECLHSECIKRPCQCCIRTPWTVGTAARLLTCRATLQCEWQLLAAHGSS
jgi:hypothetical protein